MIESLDGHFGEFSTHIGHDTLFLLRCYSLWFIIIPTDADTSLEDHIFKMLRAAYCKDSNYKQYDVNNRDVGPGFPERSTENRLLAARLQARKLLSGLHL